MNIKQLGIKASKSKFWLWVLNKALAFTIPFNIPHGLRITAFSSTSIDTMLPLKWKNKNHLGSMHACALATIGEFTGGALVVSQLDPAKYRLILKELKMEYFYQAKTDVIARFEMSDEELNTKIIEPLTKESAIFFPIIVKVFDLNNNHVCTASTNWQLKSWQKTTSKK
jgi:hypothetical protein